MIRARIKQNVIDLTRDIMTMQAVGDYAAATQMIEKLAVVRPPVQVVLDRLKDVPVDIEPRFVTAEQLLAGGRGGREEGGGGGRGERGKGGGRERGGEAHMNRRYVVSGPRPLP